MALQFPLAQKCSAVLILQSLGSLRKGEDNFDVRCGEDNVGGLPLMTGRPPFQSYTLFERQRIFSIENCSVGSTPTIFFFRLNRMMVAIQNLESQA